MPEVGLGIGVSRAVMKATPGSGCTGITSDRLPAPANVIEQERQRAGAQQQLEQEWQRLLQSGS